MQTAAARPGRLASASLRPAARRAAGRAAPRVVSVRAEKVRDEKVSAVALSGGRSRFGGPVAGRRALPPRPSTPLMNSSPSPPLVAGRGPWVGARKAGCGPMRSVSARLVSRRRRPSAPRRARILASRACKRPLLGSDMRSPTPLRRQELSNCPLQARCGGASSTRSHVFSLPTARRQPPMPSPLTPSPLPSLHFRSSASTWAPPTPPAASWRAGSPPSSPTRRALARRHPSSRTLRRATAWSGR